MFTFVDVGSRTCKSSYTLFESKVGVAMAQFPYNYMRSLAVTATDRYWQALTATCSVMGLFGCNKHVLLHEVKC